MAPLFELDPQTLLRAYASGIFPMADDRDAPGIYWVEPKLRGILPLDGFHLSRSLRKLIASDRYRVTADQAFEDIIRLCAESASDRPETWINGTIEQAFNRLHEMGLAHSVEVWDGSRLVGGLYGLALGQAFFGESMVSRAPSASKVALGWLVARLRVGGFRLLDCQFLTDHLATMGVVEVPKKTYSVLLAGALGLGSAGASGLASAAFDALDRRTAGPGDAAPAPADTVSGPLSGKDIVQLLGHTS
ncbi:leucyl/phenylalanyl-tRNA--protein transferase [Sphingomonas sp. Leaf24]|uniref:leucyl/phenylalanyl-tRNA--protein transferase n=1 Tax=unclassified Sphingomonas TaxID=196159 RepID=UPI0006F1CC96|nr:MULTISPECIES: leucyl/phenylalanyl-tRNA--protein transferase [unclassified Sphingomonas]KQM13247.1 leucyl/phenylalanyl-tRNA--protein transferase [Sphingomonas sp. Leaf5]KQM85833.1 leucyl/phenylalanyl-tRNA--protein transferase [Sphingomonas sp. Leaf24]KQM95331.1 leucyl/phenylalanyl-tRNA--protein transferase [Sphingomonas sp. Leaf22]